MMNKSPIVIVMGMGGGKSLSFMLLVVSYLSNIIIVVVLLVLLQGDLIEWYWKIKILCTK